MSEFYAHSKEGADVSQWQLLVDHLNNVSRLAEKFAKEFKSEEWGKIAGLLHDLGKFALAFFLRLQGGPKIDHSSAGAKEAIRLYDPAVGKILAYIIAGHHAGLPNGAGQADRKTLAYRLSDANEIPDYAHYKNHLTLNQAQLKLPITPHPENMGFSISFFIRMLYSCLVDADFLDTEAFMSPEKTELRPPDYALKPLCQTLDNHLDALCAQAKPTKVNKWRAEILEQCRTASQKEPGLFSLTVPTGGGKTLSSLSFALNHAIKHGFKRIIYVIPYTSIIEQNAKVFRKVLGDEVILEHHSNYVHPDDKNDNEFENAQKLKLATENWDAPIIVTTNVQFLESLFANRSSKCRKLHNIAKSVVIMDEAQMLPSELLIPCLAAIRELAQNYQTSLVLCTATQPALTKQSGLEKGLENVREIVDQPQKLYEAFKRVSVRNLGKMGDPDLAERIKAHDHEQSLCIVNTRNHAKELFKLIANEKGAFHLSALMCPKHRTQVIAQIKEQLKQKAPCRVISTQLVEAGVDLDFPIVYRAACGIDSLAQAAGRCNREGLLKGKGQVFAFTPGKGLLRGYFQQTAQMGSNILASQKDPLCLEAVHEYFTQIFGLQGDGLDQEKIMDLFEKGIKDFDFSFFEAAQKFKIIKNNMHDLIIPFDETAEDLIERLPFSESSLGIQRKLQPYTIQIYREQMAELMKSRVINTINERFHVLTSDQIYDPKLGLCPEDPTYRSPEDCCF